jgi:hypothetical protein
MYWLYWPARYGVGGIAETIGPVTAFAGLHANIQISDFCGLLSLGKDFG